jgi:predicted alpha/beta superfamily hydrolase
MRYHSAGSRTRGLTLLVGFGLAGAAAALACRPALFNPPVLKDSFGIPAGREVLPGKLRMNVLERTDSRAPGPRATVPATSRETAQYPPVTIDDTELRHLKSKYTGEDYEIDLFLPPGYRQGTESYPAVYVLDAEYNFGCVSYIARRLIKNGDVPKLVLVGIAYGPADEDHYDRTRIRDCTPPSKVHGYHTGGAENFVRFFREELIPFVETDYRLCKESRTLVGHSIGGFFCGYVLFNHPRIFDNYLIVSPSFWFSDEVVFEYEKRYAQKNKSLEAVVFLATGADESGRMVQTTSRFISVMKSRTYEGLKFKSLIPEGEHHRSIFPLAFTRGLQFIFGAAKSATGRQG